VRLIFSSPAAFCAIEGETHAAHTLPLRHISVWRFAPVRDCARGPFSVLLRLWNRADSMNRLYVLIHDTTVSISARRGAAEAELVLA